MIQISIFINSILFLIIFLNISFKNLVGCDHVSHILKIHYFSLFLGIEKKDCQNGNSIHLCPYKDLPVLHTTILQFCQSLYLLN